MKNTLVYTVAFPQVKNYYKQFFDSLSEQDTYDFDFLVVRENVDINNYIRNLKVDTKIIDVAIDTTPVKNRILAINYAIDNGYENIVAIDIDDIMDSNRVSKVIKGLNEHDIYIHDLRLIDENASIINKSFINHRIEDHKIINFNDIEFYNFIGFGNMGFKTKWVKNAIPIPLDIVAVDWWIVSIMLLEGASAIYYDEVLTSYRQYDNNIASLNTVSIKSFLKQIEIVYNHYHNILERYSYLKKSKVYDVYTKVKNIMLSKNSRGINREINEILIKQRGRMFWWELVDIVTKEVTFGV